MKKGELISFLSPGPYWLKAVWERGMWQVLVKPLCQMSGHNVLGILSMVLSGPNSPLSLAHFFSALWEERPMLIEDIFSNCVQRWVVKLNKDCSVVQKPRVQSAKAETDIPLHDHLQVSYENIGFLYPNQNALPHVNLFGLHRVCKEEKWVLYPIFNKPSRQQ